MQPLARGDGRAREVRVARDVLDPRRAAAAPDPPGQPDAAGERACVGSPLRTRATRSTGGCQVSRQRIVACAGSTIQTRAVIAAQDLAERAAGCAARPAASEARLGERASRLVLGVQPADRVGWLGLCSWVRAGPGLVGGDVTPRLAVAYDPRAHFPSRGSNAHESLAQPRSCSPLAALAGPTAAAEEVDLAVVHRIKAEAFQNGKVMDHLFFLTDVNGPRLTASPGQRAAADWAVARLKSWGIASARTEPWGRFGRSWQLKRYAAHLLTPSYAPLHGVPLAWSGGTRGPRHGGRGARTGLRGAGRRSCARIPPRSRRGSASTWRASAASCAAASC